MAAATGISAADRVRGLLELLRPHNLIVAALTTYIGYGSVAASFASSLYDGSYTLLALLVVVMVAAGGYAVNDYFDVATDKIVKPWRPIPSGRVPARAALALSIILVAGGVVLSAALSLPLLVFAAANAVLVVEYSRWIKRTGFLGNLVVALNSAATILFGALAKAVHDGVGLPLASLAPVAIAFSLVLGREIVKGVEDFEGDREECYLTLAVRMGPARAAKVASIVLLVTVAVSPVPLVWGGYTVAYAVLAAATDVMVLYTVYKLSTAGEGEVIDVARRARTMLKLAFLVGALAFIAGLPFNG